MFRQKILLKINKFYTFSMRENRLLVIALLFLFVFSITIKAFATYPTTPFVPSDQENDPSCSPGDANCYVTPMAIGETVGSGTDYSVLFIDENGDLAEDNANFLYDNSSGYLYSDNLSLTENLNITTTTGSDVGVITKDSVRFLHTYKPAGTNDNLFIGKSSGNFTLSATSNLNGNTGVGENALTSISSGYYNSAFGLSALRYLTSGNDNTAIGMQAGVRITSGDYNTALGTSALYGAGSPSSLTGSYNVGLGNTTLYSLSTGSNNVAIGYQAGLNSSSASNNIFIGFEAGHDITTESGNIFIGYQAGADATGSDQLYIENSNSTSPLIYGDFANDYVNINGRLGIGTSTPDFELEAVSGSQNIEFVGTAYAGKKIVFGGRSANGTEGSPTASTAGDILAEFSGLGYYTGGTSGFTSSTTGGMRVYAEGTFTDASYPTQLRFVTTDSGSTTLSTRMVILANGNVGIGDNTPDNSLDIASTTNTGIAISASGADVDPYIKFELADGTPSFTMGVDDSDSDSFKISTTALGTSDRFIIDSSGNVNVGGDGTPGSLFSVGSTSQFQVGSSGSIDAVTTITTSGGIIIGSAGTGALSVGSTSGVYRTTNGGSNVTPQTIFDVDNSNSTAGSQAYIFDTNSGLVFTAANGARRIARASIDITNLTNTAGSETGDLAFSTKPSGAAITERLRIDASGEVGIGDTTPDYLLDVENTSVDTDIFALTDSDGACLHNPEAGAETVTCSSDERLKENIVDAGDILPYFMDFRIREYDVLASGDHMTGVVAQEVMETYPDLVRMGGNGFYTVELPSTWQIIKGIQELKISIDDLESFDLENENSMAQKIIVWLADATNGIQNIFAKRVTVEELCVEDICLTKTDLINILESQDGYNPPVTDPVEDPVVLDETNTGGEPEGPTEDVQPEDVPVEENIENTGGDENVEDPAPESPVEPEPTIPEEPEAPAI